MSKAKTVKREEVCDTPWCFHGEKEKAKKLNKIERQTGGNRGGSGSRKRVFEEPLGRCRVTQG